MAGHRVPNLRLGRGAQQQHTGAGLRLPPPREQGPARLLYPHTGRPRPPPHPVQVRSVNTDREPIRKLLYSQVPALRLLNRRELGRAGGCRFGFLSTVPTSECPVQACLSPRRRPGCSTSGPGSGMRTRYSISDKVRCTLSISAGRQSASFQPPLALWTV